MSAIERDVVIIGAGASGLMCAVECGKRGRSVVVLDHAGRIGSKVLVSGGGRSNFSNIGVGHDDYLSRNPHFCKSALAGFTPGDFVDMLKRHGIGCHEEEGRLFCDGSGKDIVRMLKSECSGTGVEIRLHCRVSGIRKNGQFAVSTSLGTFRSESVVVATGGLSFPGLGASGLGHRIARQFGLEVTPLKAGLVPFRFNAPDRARFGLLSGISVNASVRCGKKEFTGDILFTHRGLSGPAILRVSLYWSEGDAVAIDLLPEIDILPLLIEKHGSKMEMTNFLSVFLPKRLAETWLGPQAGPKPLNRHTLRELKDISHRLHHWEFVPSGTEGYEKAEVTAGGVATSELSSRTMEARKTPGLYFIGEVVDVTGQLGGFNLHWAWASGHAAGRYA